jgi:hypothetical protein
MVICLGAVVTIKTSSKDKEELKSSALTSSFWQNVSANNKMARYESPFAFLLLAIAFYDASSAVTSFNC